MHLVRPICQRLVRGTRLRLPALYLYLFFEQRLIVIYIHQIREFELIRFLNLGQLGVQFLLVVHWVIKSLIFYRLPQLVQGLDDPRELLFERVARLRHGKQRLGRVDQQRVGVDGFDFFEDSSHFKSFTFVLNSNRTRYRNFVNLNDNINKHRQSKPSFITI